MPQIAADPVPEGADASGSPMDQGFPDTAAKAATSGASAPAPKAADKDKPPAIPTGFPEPAVAEEPPKAKDGNVILAAPERRSVTLPPLDEGGETVVITADGTEVDEDSAQRAHAAALAAGFRLREL